MRIGARPIQEDDICRVFEVMFDRYDLISYTVLNETYGKYPEPPEAFTGKLFASSLIPICSTSPNAPPTPQEVMRDF